MDRQARVARDTDERPHLSVSLAATTHEVDAAHRLRYRVFSEEMGARLASRSPGRDEDAFDAWCEHPVVRDERVWVVLCPACGTHLPNATGARGFEDAVALWNRANH